MEIIDGKKISNQIKEEIKVEVDSLKALGKKIPHLAAVIVGEDGASLTYVGSKVRSCKQVGFNSTLVKLAESITENELLDEIYKLNNNDSIDGFIVQLPLPKHIDEQKILLAIDPNKDVDGFHPTNFGKMALNMRTFIPATPYGIIELIKRYGIETLGKQTVVIGISHIVGRPISILMNNKGDEIKRERLEYDRNYESGISTVKKFVETFKKESSNEATVGIAIPGYSSNETGLVHNANSI